MEYALPERKEFFILIEGKKSYTASDIEVLPEGERAELIDGEFFMMASPTYTHQDLLMWISIRIKMYITDDRHNYVEPDITVICDEKKLDEKGCHGAPDWVIEIVSPSSKYMDYVRKLILYEGTGVREYWLVDPERESILVYRLERREGPELYSFADKVKAGIYEDFMIDFGEYIFKDFSKIGAR